MDEVTQILIARNEVHVLIHTLRAGAVILPHHIIGLHKAHDALCKAYLTEGEQNANQSDKNTNEVPARHFQSICNR